MFDKDVARGPLFNIVEAHTIKQKLSHELLGDFFLHVPL